MNRASKLSTGAWDNQGEHNAGTHSFMHQSCLTKCFIDFTTTEQAFGPSHLSRLPLDPGPKSALVPGPTASRGSVGGQGPFVPVGDANRDQSITPLSRLVAPSGTIGPRTNGGIWSRLVDPTGKKGPCLYPLSSSPARAIQLSVLAVLGSGGGSCCPFRPRFVKTL